MTLSAPAVLCMTHELGPFYVSVRIQLRPCSTSHIPGYGSHLPCDWPSTAWAYFHAHWTMGPAQECHSLWNTLFRFMDIFISNRGLNILPSTFLIADVYHKLGIISRNVLGLATDFPCCILSRRWTNCPVRWFIFRFMILFKSWS